VAIVGRYAPSPSGRQHLGNARTALLAWLQARGARGRFVLRMEDLDPSRSQAIYAACILDDLRWLGLDWDEGPDVGGGGGPYAQSERSDRYEAALTRLDTFPCTCTRRELRDSASAPHGIEPVYPGTCRHQAPRADRPAATRWCAPPGRAVADDVQLGSLAHDVATEIGDFVLRRADGAWAYQLAVVVDDAAMGVTDVVRGDDLWTSTPRQVWLQGALGLPTPRYLHVPLLLGPDGTKLSKRHGAPEVAALREAGVEPERVIAVLARSFGLVGPEVRRVRATSLVGAVDPARIRSADARLDPAALA